MKNYGLLILVSAIWGFSYIFMKMLSPVYGGYFVAFSRLFIGGTFLLIYNKINRVEIKLKENFKHYLVIAIFNCALPLTCFSLAALYIDASLSVVVNSLSPILASMYGIYFLKEKLSTKQIIGLLMAFSSVVYITLLKDAGQSKSIILGVVLAFSAANGYAISSIYINLKAKHVNSRAIAGVSTFMGSLLILPIALYSVETTEVTLVFQFLFLGIVCTGIANAIYFYLITQIGTKALSTTFIQPIFGSLWAVIFLGEVFTFKMVVTTIVIIIGVYIFLSDKLKTSG